MYLYLIEIFLVIYSLEVDLQIIFVQVTRKYFFAGSCNCSHQTIKSLYSRTM